MDTIVEKQADKYVNARRRKKRWHKVVSVLAAVVIFCTTYALILPAITVQGETYCGMEEHVAHTDQCYEQVRTLTCQLSEEGHTHTGDCYEEQSVLRCDKEETDGHAHGDACYAGESVLICTNEAPDHVHGDGCYETQKVLTCGEAEREAHHHDENCFLTEQVLACGKEEQEPHQHTDDCYTAAPNKEKLICNHEIHQHTLQCYSNPAADVESASTWEKSFASAKLTGNWSENILSIAKTQLGYAESIHNYMVAADGATMKGYTRYGDWYGDAYGDWCAMFCSFCIHYAGVEDYPLDANCGTWVDALSERRNGKEQYYHTAGEYTPKPGDLIFFDWDEFDASPDSRSPDHVGFVCEIIEATETSAAQIRTIEGNNGNSVKYMLYQLDDSRIMGYGEMPDSSRFNQEITGGGKHFSVNVQYSEEAGLLDATRLKTSEIAEGSEKYDAYYQQVLDRLPAGDRLAFCRLFDISLISNGRTTEPNAPVKTTITLDSTPLEDGLKVGVLHFAENGPEFLAPTLGVNGEGQNTISFVQSSFSVVALYGFEPTAESNGGRAGGSVVKPSYPAYIAPSGAKTGETSVGDVLGKYWSDPATSQLESLFNGVPSDDGKVLTDKSVIYGQDDYNAFASYPANTFGVTLSALGQTYPLTEELNVKVPIDVVFVLDTSGSMINTVVDGRTSASIMVESLNDIMDYILKENEDNRVGVVCFSGGGHELLELGHYTAPNGEYFQEGAFEGKDHNSIILKASAGIGRTDGTLDASKTFTGWWGTYTQHGIATGAELFLKTKDTTVTRTVTKQLADGEITATYTAPRRPVFILLSDGDPTYCTDSYSDVLNAAHIYGGGNSGYNNAGVAVKDDPYTNTYQNNKGILGYYTILSAQSYKEQVTAHYNTDTYFYSIGIGMNQSGSDSFSMSVTGDDYKRAVLNPSAANIGAIANCTNGRSPAGRVDNADQGDISGFSEDTCHLLYKLLNNRYTSSTVNISWYNDNGDSEKTYGVPGITEYRATVIRNPFINTGYNYADGAYFTTEATVDGLTKAFKEAVNFSKNLTVYGFILKNNEPVLISDTIGAGMELKGAPILRYGGENYTPAGQSTSGNVTTYHYSGIYHDPNSGATVDLSNVTAEVETVDGKQTVRLLVPDAQLPAYLPEMDNNGNTYFYYEALPARLVYQVGLTAESEEAVRALEWSGGQLTYYANEWSPSDYAYSNFEPTTKNPYYMQNTYNRAPLGKTQNTTGTRTTAWEYDASCNATYVAEYLGNNGKLTFSSEKHESVAVTLQKVDATGRLVTNDTARFAIYMDAALTKLVDIYETDAHGVLSIPSLRTDYTYYLKEVKAPNGYVLLSEPLVFTIGADKSITLPENHDPHITLGDGLEIRISNDFAPTRVVVQKQWDGLASGESHPASVQFQLYADGAPYGTAVTCSEANGWTYAWENLPILSTEDLHEIIYTVEELNVPDGYQVVRSTGQNGEQIITNFKISMKSVSVQKKWVGGEGPSVLVELLRNERPTGQYATLSAENDWFYKWENLVNCDENGEITYSVREFPVDGYESKIHLWFEGDPDGETAVPSYTQVSAFEDGGQYLLVLGGRALTVNSAGSGLALTGYNTSVGAAADPSTLWTARRSGNGYTLTSVSTGKSLELTRSWSGFSYSYYVSLSSGSTAWSFANGEIYSSSRYWTATLNNNRLEASRYSAATVTAYKYGLTNVPDASLQNKGDFHYIIVNTKPTGTPSDLTLTFRKVKAGDTLLLAGAKFELYRETGLESDLLIPQTTDRHGEQVQTWTTEAGTPMTVTLTQDGVYYLVETAAPIGYAARKEPIVFKVATTKDGNRTAATLAGAPIPAGEIFTSMDIPNTYVATHKLPETGGMGTTCFYVLGTVLVAGALLCSFDMRRRREKGKR